MNWRLTRKRIRRAPTILQMEAAECGAACLGMVLAYYGAWVPLEQLRIECGVSRDGSKASNIVRAAKRLGLSAKGFRQELSALGSATTPCIIHWNFNHFVVLEGIKGKFAYINDPAFGRRRIDIDELDRSFTGVVLTMEPAAGFARRGTRPGGLNLLLRELRGSRAAVGLLVFLSLLMVIPGLVAASFSKIFIDDILVQHLTGWLRPLLIGMAATAVVRTALTLLQQSLLLRLQTKLSVVMISRFLWRVMALPIEFFAQRHAGDIAARVGANEQIARLLAGGIAANALSLTSIGFFAAAMAVYDVPLAALCIGLSLLNVLCLQMSTRRRAELSRALSLERGKLCGAVVSTVRSIETIKASGLEDEAFGQCSGIQAKLLNAERELASSSIVLDTIPTLISGLTATTILIFGGLRVIEGSLTLGSLVAFQSLMASFSEPVATLVNQAGSFQMIKGALDRLGDVYNYPAGDAPRTSPAEAPVTAKLAGRIELRNIHFGYSLLEPPLISDFSITVNPGSRVALVGTSGSGKSTIGRLVCGLYKPWGGEILLDGTRLQDIPPQVLAASIAYVDQDIFLFEGTVRDNLTLWDPTTPEVDLSIALTESEIRSEIAARVGNYDTHVNEGGVNFSGGQRQRIEIARALVGRPAIIVLDEATAALDPITEKTIDDNLRRRGCTCIIIAHRLSTIRDCDEIIVLQQGKVVERGTHEALLASNGEYARLVSQE